MYQTIHQDEWNKQTMLSVTLIHRAWQQTTVTMSSRKGDTIRSPQQYGQSIAQWLIACHVMLRQAYYTILPGYKAWESALSGSRYCDPMTSGLTSASGRPIAHYALYTNRHVFYLLYTVDCRILLFIIMSPRVCGGWGLTHAIHRACIDQTYWALK